MLKDFSEYAHALADASGAVIRPYFGTNLTVELKADESPVSRADREAEVAMRAMLTARFPEHGIYGEEYGVQAPQSSRYSWVIDPIDGTRAFLAGGKEWGTLIALCDNGVPILGVLDQPVTGERWWGALGQPSAYRDAQGAVCTLNLASGAQALTLSAASLSTTSRDYFTPGEAKQFVRLAEQCGAIIENGDCYAYGLLARGKRDLVVDAGLKPYDILALVPIIAGAGGSIAAWDGAAITLDHFRTAIATANAILHAQVLEWLSDRP